MDLNSTHFRAPPPSDPLVRADALHFRERRVLLGQRRLTRRPNV